MKKTLVLSILGLGLSAATVSAQSSFEFGTYVGGNFFGAPVSYAASNVPAGKAGLAVGSDFSATAFYSVNAGATWNVLSSSTSSFFGTDGDLGSGAGYFYGGTVPVPVPINTSVLMYVAAANTVTIGTYAPGQIVGQSAPFSITVVDAGLPVQPNLGGTTYSSFTVAAVPEPSTFALAGLGLASLLIFRRRK